jgi:hypothetical protein
MNFAQWVEIATGAVGAIFLLLGIADALRRLRGGE